MNKLVTQLPPELIQNKIKEITEARNKLAHNEFLVDDKEALWGVTELSNYYFQDIFAVYIVLSFYLRFFTYLDRYINTKYKVELKSVTDKNLGFEDNIVKYKDKLKDLVSKDDLRWINDLTATSVIIVKNTSNERNYLRDIVVLSNLRDKRIEVLDYVLKNGSIDEHKDDLNDSFYSFVNDLLLAKYIDENQIKMFSITSKIVSLNNLFSSGAVNIKDEFDQRGTIDSLNINARITNTKEF